MEDCSKVERIVPGWEDCKSSEDCNGVERIVPEYGGLYQGGEDCNRVGRIVAGWGRL